MADDILKALTDSYSSVGTNIDNDKQNINHAVGQTVATRRMKEYTEELKKIKEIRNAEANRYKELYKAELNAGKYSQKVKADLLKQEISHYTSLYNLNKQLHEQQTAVLEAERDVYKNINDSGKITLKNQFELYSLKTKEQELEKQTAEYKIKKFEETIDKVKKGFETVVSHLFKRLDELDNIRVWDNWIKGITDLQSQYESNFTEISGRLGVSTGIDTHNLIGNVLTDVESNDIYMKGLNFNNEVFPQITDAVKRGFQGEKAEEIGLSTAIDKKIMPWLDTTSDTWTDLQYNLDDRLLNQLKGQQLQLQATQEGNRILQNGVASQITDSLAPTLLNIDANTTDVSALSGQAQAMVSSLMDNGYSKQDAIKMANQVIDAYQNPFKALTSGSTADKLYALGGLQGGDIASSLNFADKFLQTGANGNWATSAAYANLGFITNGQTRTIDWILDHGKATEAANKYTGSDFEGTYNDKVNNLTEYVTATQKNDNEKQNESVIKYFNNAFGNHKLDIDKMILEEIKSIKSWLITGLIAGLVTSLGNKAIDKIIGKLGSSSTLPNVGGQSGVGKNILQNIGGKLGSGLLPNASSLPGAKTLGFMSSGTGAILGTTAGVAAGGYLVKEGIQGITESNNVLNDKTSNDIELKNAESGKRLSIGATVGGAAGAAGILALGASNPIGWVALALGGLAIGVKKYKDHLAELDDASAQVAANFDESRKSIENERKCREDQIFAIKENLESYKTTDEKLEYLRKSGLEPNIDKTRDVNEQLDEYLNNLIHINDKDADTAENMLSDIEADLKNATNENIDDVKAALLENYNAKTIANDLKLDYNNLSDDDKKKIWNVQKSALKKTGAYSDEDLQGLYYHWANGPAGYDELKGFLDKGAIQGDNIGSFEDAYEKGNVNVGGINYLMQQAGAKNKDNDEDLRLVDYNEISANLKPYAEKIAALKRWKDDDKQSIDYNEEKYNQYKEDILNLPEKYKSSLTLMFKSINEKDAMSDWPNSLKGFKVGSSYIPYDMIAQLHAGERVLTANQNKEYTQELQTGNGSIIVNSIQDVVSAIQNQTKTIIDYLSTMNFNNSSGFKKLSMLPSMGNTKVTL